MKLQLYKFTGLSPLLMASIKSIEELAKQKVPPPKLGTIPNKGDYLGAEVGRQPLIICRHTDMSVHVFYNRCPHKGVRVTTEPCGNTGKQHPRR